MDILHAAPVHMHGSRCKGRCARDRTYICGRSIHNLCLQPQGQLIAGDFTVIATSRLWVLSIQIPSRAHGEEGVSMCHLHNTTFCVVPWPLQDTAVMYRSCARTGISAAFISAERLVCIQLHGTRINHIFSLSKATQLGMQQS